MGQMSSSERLVRLLGILALLVSMVTYATGETLAGPSNWQGLVLLFFRPACLTVGAC